MVFNELIFNLLFINYLRKNIYQPSFIYSMKIIIHGGFFSESDQSHEVKTAKQNSLKEIAQKAFEYLQTHSAFDSVAYAVSLLEDDPLYNAGIGSQIQSDGIIRMSAAIMNGETQKLSGVINIQEVKNPVFVAKELIGEDDRVGWAWSQNICYRTWI
jgi:L-asparaginase